MFVLEKKIIYGSGVARIRIDVFMIGFYIVKEAWRLGEEQLNVRQQCRLVFAFNF
jgi:hypothetical protein